MKRIISIVLLLVCVLAASAQIQRNILGFTLGETTKTQVYDYLKENQYNITDNPIKDGCMINTKVEFLGYTWAKVFISFFDDKFYSVSFYDDDEYALPAMLKERFTKLSRTLNLKYFYYFQDDQEDSKYYSDDKVYLVLHRDIDSLTGKRYILLSFMDLKLMDKKALLDQVKVSKQLISRCYSVLLLDKFLKPRLSL